MLEIKTTVAYRRPKKKKKNIHFTYHIISNNKETYITQNKDSDRIYKKIEPTTRQIHVIRVYTDPKSKQNKWKKLRQTLMDLHNQNTQRQLFK